MRFLPMDARARDAAAAALHLSPVPHESAAAVHPATLRDLLEEFERSDAPRRELPAPDGGRYLLERAPARGVRARLVECRADGTEHECLRTYEPAAARPDGYPATLPFVAGRAVRLSTFAVGGGAGLAWTVEPDAADALVEMLVAASVADGWQERGHSYPLGAPDTEPLAADLLALDLGVRELVRDDRRRFLHVTPAPSGASVTLLEGALGLDVVR